MSGSTARADLAGQLEILIDDANGRPIPCRIHLTNENGKTQAVADQPFWHDHFVCSGRCTAALPPGKYDFVIERGPEYYRRTGHLEIKPGDEHKLSVTLNRIANLRYAGWYSGDLHVHRPLKDIELLMRAEDLDFAPVITWWNSRNIWDNRVIPNEVVRRFDGHRIYTIMAGEDEREGGALLYFGLESPLDITASDREFPSPMQFVVDARKRNPDVWIDIEKPFWWDVPVWLASGEMNSVGVANNHMCRSQMYPSEAWGKPRNEKRLPRPRGNGYWTQEIYYHILDAGLRVPPSAGSASGVLPNPVGYNRVYVHLEEPFSTDAWFRGLSSGRSFLTNGPLLLVTADGQAPGEVFKLASGESRRIELVVQITSQDPIANVEIIKNGQIAHSIRCSERLTQSHRFPISVDEPGWFLVRVIAEVEHTFRFATTAPWFVESVETKDRISRTSAQFFLDWVDERICRVKANIPDSAQREQVLDWHRKARRFWMERLRTANAE